MATISWGKPKIFIGAAGAAPLASNASIGTGDWKWQLLSTPVEDSTNLTGTQGDKTEATIEGGEAEATKYGAATFELTMNVRMALDTSGSTEVYRYLPDAMYSSTGLANHDEYTSKSVAVCLIPQEESAPGFFCPDCTVSIMESYTAADGAMWEITLAPNASATVKAVQWGQYYDTEGTNTNAGKYIIKKGVRGAS
jgi:hypothetical protein